MSGLEEMLWSLAFPHMLCEIVCLLLLRGGHQMSPEWLQAFQAYNAANISFSMNCTGSQVGPPGKLSLA
jgi:hypothetical protein